MMEWIMDNIVIVAGILFFLVSSLGKIGGQAKSEQPPRKAPQQEHPSGQGPYGETYSMDEDDDDSEYVETPSYDEREKQRPARPARAERDLSQPVRLNAEEINREMDARNRRMQKELEGMYAHLDRGSSGSYQASDSGSDAEGSGSSGGSSRLASQAAQGVVWSEILGPPRARRPMGRRR